MIRALMVDHQAVSFPQRGRFLMHLAKGLLFFTLSCVGCGDITARQQRAEQARRQKTLNELRDLGERLHNTPSDTSAAKAEPTVAPESTPDSSP
jgi:hypothetical protein